MEARCRAATAAYKKWARESKIPSSAIVKRVTCRWVQGQWPNISMEHAKAAALRKMLPWVASLARERTGTSEVATLRATCLAELEALDALYDRQPRFLSADQEQQAQRHCRTALEALAQLCRLQPQGPWRLVPKAHALHHIAWHSAMANPRVSHCYQDEDFIGRVKQLYTACHGATAPLRSLQRYCLGTAILLTAREQVHLGQRRSRAPPPPDGRAAAQRKGGRCSCQQRRQRLEQRPAGPEAGKGPTPEAARPGPGPARPQPGERMICAL